ncbi:hypothetical protein [Novosphingobium sp.]|uniref:hypothetical protein n=1 Tax=Novosphingobium sp. TaxID=1874826 RepID=UPI0038BCAD8E
MPDISKPAVRRLQVYAFDPQASVTLSMAMFNNHVIELPWEARWEDPLEKGPVNDYLEVIDYDPASGLFYEPIDLDNKYVLAQGGLNPSEGLPQFHQQMVFAVAMRTIRAFERALGRVVLWARDEAIEFQDTRFSDLERNFTKRLRIYPHALREANAYYSPAKRALLFGYFKPDDKAGDVQASWVFSCLSQDIIAHETTHAILHGLRQRSIEPSSVDALAFHEAFADIVALLQHFTVQPVVRHLLAQSEGSLRASGLLSGLADQFGRATGRDGALRYALKALGDRVSTAGDNTRQIVNDAIEALRKTTEPHARGAFLVAAVFDAFATIYERRTADLFRLARPGLVAGNGLGPDLVARLADEAGKAADQVMRMCIRALDYTPPVDLRFGEYLRAIITADMELVPHDPLNYRVAFVEAFRRWGITVPGCISMAPDSLVWDSPDYQSYPEIIASARKLLSGATLRDPADALSIRFTELLSTIRMGVSFASSGTDETYYNTSDYQVDGRNMRDLAMQIVLHNQRAIHHWFNYDSRDDEDWEKLVGLRLRPEKRRVGVQRLHEKVVPPLRSLDCKGHGNADGTGWDRLEPSFDVNSARISRRSGPDGQELHLLIFQITQKRRGYFARDEQVAADNGTIDPSRFANRDFWFRGGATLHVDLRDGRLLRIIRKRIDNNDRLEEERAFRCGETTGEPAFATGQNEPFAFVHRCA